MIQKGSPEGIRKALAERKARIEAESFARTANRLHKQASKTRAIFVLGLLGGTAIVAYTLFLALVALGVIP